MKSLVTLFLAILVSSTIFSQDYTDHYFNPNAEKLAPTVFQYSKTIESEEFIVKGFIFDNYISYFVYPKMLVKVMEETSKINDYGFDGLNPYGAIINKNEVDRDTLRSIAKEVFKTEIESGFFNNRNSNEAVMNIYVSIDAYGTTRGVKFSIARYYTSIPPERLFDLNQKIRGIKIKIADTQLARDIQAGTAEGFEGRSNLNWIVYHTYKVSDFIDKRNLDGL